MAGLGQEYLKQILDNVQQGKVVLFLGAGATHAAGGPTATELTKSIKEKFKDVDQSLNNFIDVCQDVVDTPPYSKIDLETFIKDKLLSLHPTEEYKYLVNYDWTCIFTTNFDDLVEYAYRMYSHRICIPIYSESIESNLFDRDKLHLFKIMGSVSAIQGETRMVLTRADYNRALVRRREHFKLLSDVLKNGIMLFIGYSFDDRLVLDVIDELINIHGKEKLPWSYALFDKIEMNDKVRYKFSSRKIIPIECGFQSFIKYLNQNYTESSKSEIVDYHIKIGDQLLDIGSATYKQCSEYFDLLTESDVNSEPGSIDDFFKGINKNWGAFREDWDFKRDMYIDPNFQRTINSTRIVGNLRDRIFEEIKNYKVNNNKVILITGMAGVGKTMLLKRLAYDIYISDLCPVIFLKSDKVSIDYKMLTSFIESLNDQIYAKNPTEKYAPIKSVIFVDDAASLIRHVNRLKDYLTSRNKPVLIIASERKNEWDLMYKTFPFKLPEENIYELNEQLSNNEKIQVTDHFYKLGYLPYKSTYWEDMIEKDFQNSLFATIYTWINPAKKPLNDIIRDQYMKLTDDTQIAFKYICALHQFNLPINIELIVRLLKCTWDHYYDYIMASDAEKVIFEEEDIVGNILLRTHHRIIAQKTVESFFNDPEEQKIIFLDVLNSAILTNKKEKQIIEKLLIEFIGPNARPQILSLEQQRQLFKAICKRYPTRSLIHHWGILEMEDEQFEEAEKLLIHALELPRENMEAFRGESDQNILTTLGNLYARMSMHFVMCGEDEKSKESLEKAEDCFKNSKHGEFPNAHAYHAHANMWYKIGRRSANEFDKSNHFAKSLEIISMAKDNLNEDDLQYILQLETQIWGELGIEDKIKENIEYIRDTYDSSRGYCLYAELQLRKSRGEISKSDRKSILEQSLNLIEDALTHFQYDENCLRLKAKIIRELYPDDIEEFYKSLLNWKAAAINQNVWLLFELGRISFILGYFDKSKEFFNELETGVGAGNRLRFRSQYPILDSRGCKKEFDGTIARIFSYDEGEIRCDSLRSLRYPIPFNPVVCRFTASVGDRVRFSIDFTFRGPRAEKVIRIS